MAENKSDYFLYKIFVVIIFPYKNTRGRTVPDRRVRNIPEVVLVRRWVSWGSGNLEGEGWVRGGSREGQFTSNLRPRWTIPVTARRVPSK